MAYAQLIHEREQAAQGSSGNTCAKRLDGNASVLHVNHRLETIRRRSNAARNHAAIQQQQQQYWLGMVHALHSDTQDEIIEVKHACDYFA